MMKLACSRQPWHASSYDNDPESVVWHRQGLGYYTRVDETEAAEELKSGLHKGSVYGLRGVITGMEMTVEMNLVKCRGMRIRTC